METLKMNRLKDVIIQMIKVNIDVLRFNLLLDNDPEHKKTYRKLIYHAKQGIETIKSVEHIEILASIYNTFMTGKEQFYVILSENIYKNVKRWDKTEEGFQEFLKLDEEGRKQFEEEKQERLKTQEAIKKAREEGKKIEMTIQNGKIVPVVVEEKPN